MEQKFSIGCHCRSRQEKTKMKYSIIEWHNIEDDFPCPYADVLFTIPSVYYDEVTIGFYDREKDEFCSYFGGINTYPAKNIKWAYVPDPPED